MIERSIVDCFENVAAVGFGWTAPMKSCDERYKKRLRFASLDHDRTIRMLPARLNLGHYNDLFKPRAFDRDRWSAPPYDPHLSRGPSFDPTIHLQPRHVHI